MADYNRTTKRVKQKLGIINLYDLCGTCGTFAEVIQQLTDDASYYYKWLDPKVPILLADYYAILDGSLLYKEKRVSFDKLIVEASYNCKHAHFIVSGERNFDEEEIKIFELADKKQKESEEKDELRAYKRLQKKFKNVQ